MDHAEAALAAWAELVAETYDDFAPTPRGIASDLNVSFNGSLQYRSVGQYRGVLREIQRRYPDWRNDMIQQFGDENGQCTVWRACGNAADGSGALDLHGVTMLDSVDGIVVAVNIYYEALSPATVFSEGVRLRAV
ncbi:hypothetical protein JT358_02165 [Micrococcales bacterium 31B]|nr:hypothetical protein [Micrococcales bacterium 31B]